MKNYLELAKKSTIQIYNTDINDKDTAVKSLEQSNTFGNYNAWLRAVQFGKVNEFLSVAEIGKIITCVARAQIFMDIKASKYIIKTIEEDKEIIKTIFDNEEKIFNRSKYTNFATFCAHIDKESEKWYKKLTDTKKLEMLTKVREILQNDKANVDDIKQYYAQNVGFNLLATHPELYDCPLKEMKDILSGKKLDEESATEESATEESATEESATEESATEESAINEKTVSQIAIELFNKVLTDSAKSDNNTLNDIAIRFTQAITDYQKA